MKKINIYGFLRKGLFKFFTLIAIKLPLWKEDKYIEVFPPLLSLPVSLPVNYDMLPGEFSAKFIKVKSIPVRRIFILKNVFISGAAAVFKNCRVFVPSLTWRDIKHFRKGELLLKQWESNNESISTNQTVALVYDTWSAYNYYHWMAEALPKLLILQKEFPDCLLLIPNPATEYITTTVSALGFMNVYPLDRDLLKVLKVSNLVLPELVYYEYDEKDVLAIDQKKLQLKQLVTTPSLNLKQEELIVVVRRKLLKLIPDKPRPLKRTYISRSRQKIRQLVNEEEVLVMLKNMNLRYCFLKECLFLSK